MFQLQRGPHQPTSSHPFQPEHGLYIHSALLETRSYRLSAIPAVSAVREQDRC